MTCHLNNLLDAVHDKKIMCIDPICDEDFHEIMKVCKKVGPGAICFDIGNIDEIPDSPPIYEIVKEPFETCWFEFNFIHSDGKKIVLGMLVIAREKVQIVSFRRKQGQWLIRGVIVTDSLSNWEKFEILPPLDIVGKELDQHKIVLSTFLSALHCNNVNKVEHTPDEKLQKARKKRGKLPIFSHWTLQLNIPQNQSSIIGTKGTHASPRVHLRRGHPRQYSPGKFTWVQPCVVGKGNGIVTKDYAVKYVNDENVETVPYE